MTSAIVKASLAACVIGGVAVLAAQPAAALPGLDRGVARAQEHAQGVEKVWGYGYRRPYWGGYGYGWHRPYYGGYGWRRPYYGGYGWRRPYYGGYGWGGYGGGYGYGGGWGYPHYNYW